MNDFIPPRRREALKRKLNELPELMVFAEWMSDGFGMNLALTDILDTRFKLNGRVWDPVVSASLESWAARQEGVRGGAEERKRTKANPAAVDIDAKGRRVGVLQCLASWVRMADEEMIAEGFGHLSPVERRRIFVAGRESIWATQTGPTVTTEAGWLAINLGWIVQQQWVDELEQDINRIWHDLRRAANERPQYHPHCGQCGARMEDDGAYFSCPACGQQVRDTAMDLRTSLAREQPLTAYDFAMFGVTPDTIRKWVERGLLERATDDHGELIMRGKRHTFWPIDVLRLADTRTARA